MLFLILRMVKLDNQNRLVDRTVRTSADRTTVDLTIVVMIDVTTDLALVRHRASEMIATTASAIIDATIAGETIVDEMVIVTDPNCANSVQSLVKLFCLSRLCLLHPLDVLYCTYRSSLTGEQALDDPFDPQDQGSLSL